jgi:hypothetical protein
MREHRTIRQLNAAWCLLGLLMMLSLAGFKCGSDAEKPLDEVYRLVLVVDPTVLRNVDAAEFNRQLGDRLHASLAHLPEDTHVDLYFVGLGQTGLPADYGASLLFDENEPNDEGHRARADSLADTVTKLVQTRWAASNEQPDDPSSCILTALYRAQEMTKLGAGRGEQVALIVVSDFLEACSDAGGYNFERMIPDSLGALPVQADLSGADRVLMLRMQTSGAVTLKDEPRLIRLWFDVLKRWRVDTVAVEFTPNFPEAFFPTSSRD